MIVVPFRLDGIFCITWSLVKAVFGSTGEVTSVFPLLSEEFVPDEFDTSEVPVPVELTSEVPVPVELTSEVPVPVELTSEDSGTTGVPLQPVNNTSVRINAANIPVTRDNFSFMIFPP